MKNNAASNLEDENTEQVKRKKEMWRTAVRHSEGPIKGSGATSKSHRPLITKESSSKEREGWIEPVCLPQEIGSPYRRDSVDARRLHPDGRRSPIPRCCCSSCDSNRPTSRKSSHRPCRSCWKPWQQKKICYLLTYFL